MSEEIAADPADRYVGTPASIASAISRCFGIPISRYIPIASVSSSRARSRSPGASRLCSIHACQRRTSGCSMRCGTSCACRRAVSKCCSAFSHCWPQAAAIAALVSISAEPSTVTTLARAQPAGGPATGGGGGDAPSLPLDAGRARGRGLLAAPPALAVPQLDASVPRRHRDPRWRARLQLPRAGRCWPRRFCSAFDELRQYSRVRRGGEGHVSLAEQRRLFLARWRSLIAELAAA